MTQLPRQEVRPLKFIGIAFGLWLASTVVEWLLDKLEAKHGFVAWTLTTIQSIAMYPIPIIWIAVGFLVVIAVKQFVQIGLQSSSPEPTIAWPTQGTLTHALICHITRKRNEGVELVEVDSLPRSLAADKTDVDAAIISLVESGLLRFHQGSWVHSTKHELSMTNAAIVLAAEHRHDCEQKSPKLPEKADRLLRSAVADNTGKITVRKTLSHQEIQASGFRVDSRASAQEYAAWTAALDQLVSGRYVTQQSESAYIVADRGWTYVYGDKSL